MSRITYIHPFSIADSMVYYNMPQGLRYIVTKMFYDTIKRWWISKRSAFGNDNTTIDNDKEEREKLE